LQAAAIGSGRVMIGRRLGSFTIQALLGAGGMGEVYRAHDSKLGRDVAIKILPASRLTDADRRARFDREARTLASLNHPHIGAIYGVEEMDDGLALVLELVEGPTLADRIVAGPIPVKVALVIASQIADALDAAHQNGIVHRDLKPANIKIRPDGVVKVLDFGLAKAIEHESASLLTHGLTADRQTQEGVILGTVAYMSPEQARGTLVDKRADVWAFGCVLYEMLTGRAPFARHTPSDSIAAILEHDPDWEALPATTPPTIRRLVQRCLDKDPARRVRDIGDAKSEIDDAHADGSSPRAAIVSSGATTSRRIPLIVVSAALLSAALGGAAAWVMKPAPAITSAPVARLTVTLPAGDTIGSLVVPSFTISRDGRTLAYAASRSGRAPQLFVRSIDSAEATALAGTEGAFSPFFSPDGRWIGFFAQGKLKKVLAKGGGLATVCDAAFGMGGAWSRDDTIYFAPLNTAGIWKVAAAGGSPQEFSRVDRTRGEVSHRYPQVLDDNRTVLFTVWTGPGWDEKHLDAQVGNEDHRRLVPGASTGRYVRSGHILYSKAGALVVVPFDLPSLTVTGSPVTLADRTNEAESEAALYDVSDTGTFVYMPGSPLVFERRLVWVHRDGTVEATGAPPAAYTDPSIAPDARSAATSIQGPTQTLWIFDFARATLTTLPSDASSQAPRWTSDGRRLLYRRTRGGYRNLFWRSADAAGDDEPLTQGEGLQTPGATSADGTYVVFSDMTPDTGRDLWMLDLRRRPYTPQPLVRTRAAESTPEISPDGRWLAYVSDESGRSEIYLRSFRNPGGQIAISKDGAVDPRWSRDGRELFFRSGDKMMAVSITPGASPAPGAPRVLFEGHYQVGDTSTGSYDVAPDGRFLMIQPTVPEQNATTFNVVLGWFADVAARIGAN
jgi:serine/threonine-protein kinase